MRARSVLFIIGLVLIALPASAAQGATRPLVPGPAQGVQATAAGGMLTIQFTGAAAALGHKLAGKQVDISCDVHPKPGLLFGDEKDVSTLRHGTVDAGGTFVRVKLAYPGDACELSPSDDFGTLARAAVTPAGAVWADEQAHAAKLSDAVFSVAPTAVYPPVAAVVAAGRGHVVALDSPDGSPPPGQVGYWTDGGTRAAYVTLSDAGRRLFVQDLGAGMQRTNALDAEVTPEPLESLKIDGSPGQSDRDGRHVREYHRKPVLAVDGVRASIVGGRLVMRFTGRSAAAFRAIAGHRVRLLCSAVPPSDLLGSVIDGPAISVRIVRVPRHGGVVALRTPRAHDDCGIADGRHLVTEAQPTARGRRYLSETTAALRFLASAPETLAARGATSYPGAATIVAQHDGLDVMSTPDAPVRRGTIGVWTDAAQQAVLATTTPDGRRLVVADEGDGVVRANATVIAIVAAFAALGG
ncbi:hypothetical protein [Baekduia sp.]|jgi:hypothetical protein|uniref:hypothetical protein n=1 Tax=Baekduia sp. TaxID=2600305 RepID=UPI002DFABC2B|nr:hypothetical protein [Baekduia sp.]